MVWASTTCSHHVPSPSLESIHPTLHLACPRCSLVADRTWVTPTLLSMLCIPSDLLADNAWHMAAPTHPPCSP